jgi:methylase of polypeptide subunit release factors
VNRLTRAAAVMVHAARRPWLARRLRRTVTERVGGLALTVPPGVFNPVLFRTGALLARAVGELPPVAAGRALDLGTGSGVGALAAARRGYRVVAVDLNPAAVAAARANAAVAGLADAVEVRHGDLFAPVRGERFDLVLLNPPYFRGAPRDDADRAWRSDDVPERFAAGLAGALAPGGGALVVLSTDGEGDSLLAALAGAGFHARPALRRDLWNEVVTVWSVLPAEPVSPPPAAAAVP